MRKTIQKEKVDAVIRKDPHTMIIRPPGHDPSLDWPAGWYCRLQHLPGLFFTSVGASLVHQELAHFSQRSESVVSF